jgi:hypothetical protein
MPTIIKPYPMRCTLADEGGSLRITIPPKSRGFLIVLLLIFGTFWTFGGVRAWSAFAAFHDAHTFDRYAQAFSLVGWIFAIIWGFGELLLIASLLYTIGGCDTILVNSDGLTRKTTFFGMGWGGMYRAAYVRDLRFRPEILLTSRTRRPSDIAFTYGGKTVGFADHIDGSEAKDVILRIRQYCAIESSPAASAQSIPESAGAA